MYCGKQPLDVTIGSILRGAMLAMMGLVLTGCGNHLAEVTGVVTLDGQPLCASAQVQATVCFQPESGEGTSAVGVVDESGMYRLSSGSQAGVPPGSYLVTFSAAEVIAAREASGTPTGRRISDPKYASARTSGLRCEVQPGTNEFDISIESAKQSSRTSRAR